MNQLIRATELHRRWKSKQMSSYMLIKEQQKIIFELSDMVIALETEKAAFPEMLDILIEQYELLLYNPFASNDAEEMRIEQMEKLRYTIEFATGLKIEEVLGGI